MANEPMYDHAPPLKVGQRVQGIFNGELRQGEVISATERHYLVRWDSGVRHTGMQGFDYGDDLRPSDEGAR